MSQDQLLSKSKKFNREKKLTQPSQIKTCGSTFKNLSSERKAWQIIKETGVMNLKGTQKFQKNTVIFS